MNDKQTITEQELKKLEFRITQLIQTCEQLKEENRALRDQVSGFSDERTKLVHKNEQARAQGRIHYFTPEVDGTHRMSKNTAVSVEIMGKEYKFACPEDERNALMDSADLLNTRMEGIRDSGKIVGADRIAVMAALNITHEMIESRQVSESLGSDLSGRIRGLRERIETALENGQQMEF